MSKDWKQALLSSGFPLEYEVSNILLDSNFHVEGEQPYTRRTQTGDEEFSVDLCAKHFVPHPENNKNHKGQLILICECKYRTPNKPWLFMPDLNEVEHAPTWPAALRYFPTFTTYSFNEEPLLDFCVQPTRAMKGIEVQVNGGEAFDKDIRHAFNQLRYAMPDVILNYFQGCVYAHPDNCKPFFVLPIVVTNSPLRILKNDVDINFVMNAKDIDEISDEVGMVDVHSPYAEDFHVHCEKIFSNVKLDQIRTEGKYKLFSKIERYHLENGGSSPFLDFISMKTGHGLDPGFFSQFPVVNLKHLPALLSEVKTAIELSLRNSKQLIFENSPTV